MKKLLLSLCLLSVPHFGMSQAKTNYYVGLTGGSRFTITQNKLNNGRLQNQADLRHWSGFAVGMEALNKKITIESGLVQARFGHRFYTGTNPNPVGSATKSDFALVYPVWQVPLSVSAPLVSIKHRLKVAMAVGAVLAIRAHGKEMFLTSYKQGENQAHPYYFYHPSPDQHALTEFIFFNGNARPGSFFMLESGFNVLYTIFKQADLKLSIRYQSGLQTIQANELRSVEPHSRSGQYVTYVDAMSKGDGFMLGAGLNYYLRKRL